MCQRSSGVVGRRVMEPEPSLAEICFLRSFILWFLVYGRVESRGGSSRCSAAVI